METQTQAPAVEIKKSKLQAVDFATLGNGLYAETVVVDGTVDANAFSAPVDDGWYVATLKRPSDPSTSFVQFGETEAKPAEGKVARKYLIINFDYVIEGHADPNVSNDDLKGKTKRFDDSVSTFVIEKDGGKTSTAVTMLANLGAILPKDTAIDIEKVAQALGNAIDSGQTKILVRTQWKAGWIKGEQGKSRGKWAFSGQSNFPLAKTGILGKGPYSSTVSFNGEEAHAMAKVVERAPIPEIAAKLAAARANQGTAR